MKTARNEPCPCGSGKKYKKCCLSQDEKVEIDQQKILEAERMEQQKILEAEREALRIEAVANEQYIDELNELNNSTIDLFDEERWDEAEKACIQLVDKFPEETDGDERFCDYYKHKGDFDKAKMHARLALEKAEGNPEKFHSDLVASLKEEIDYLDECIKAGRLVD